MTMGYAVIALGLINLVVAIVAQRRLSHLLDFVRARPDILERTGRVSDLYFIFDMSRMRYGFVHYLYRNGTAPAELAAAFPDYAELRRVSTLAYGLHLTLLVSIVALFILHRL